MNINVIHLIHFRNDPFTFVRFIEAYNRCPAGVPHELVLLLKGIDARQENEIRRLAPGASVLHVPTVGFDLTSYHLAAKELNGTHLCFLNSFSEIMCDNWLALLGTPFRNNPRVGLTGAFGSYESMATSLLRRLLFPAFPNPHLRTNAFLIERSLMLSVWSRMLFNKRLCYLFESGRWSLGHRLEHRGYIYQLVNSDGPVYNWPESETFRLGSQSKLLVQDNHTRYFDQASASERDRLSRLTWGIPALSTVSV